MSSAYTRCVSVSAAERYARAVERASQPCRWAEVNAALMLHEDKASERDARAYLRRWGLLSSDLAAHLIRFLTDPASRSYVISYPAGFELCSAYVAGDPGRFRRLLTEQVRVRDLVAARFARHGIIVKYYPLSPLGHSTRNGCEECGRFHGLLIAMLAS